VVTAKWGLGSLTYFSSHTSPRCCWSVAYGDGKGSYYLCYPRVALSENQLTGLWGVILPINCWYNIIFHNWRLGWVAQQSTRCGIPFKIQVIAAGSNSPRCEGWLKEEYGGYFFPLPTASVQRARLAAMVNNYSLFIQIQPQTLVCPVCDKKYPLSNLARDVVVRLTNRTTENHYTDACSQQSTQYLFGLTLSVPCSNARRDSPTDSLDCGYQVALLLRRLMARIRWVSANVMSRKT